MTLQDLYDRGFDESERDEEDEQHLSLGCSQCAAVFINGMPCHETGCPNVPKPVTEILDDLDEV